MSKALRTSRARHLFRRVNERVRHSGYLKAWRDRERTRLEGTQDAQVFTVVGDGVSPNFTATGHGMSAGEGPYEVSTDTTLPAGLQTNGRYYVRDVVDANTITVAEGRDRNGVLVIPTDAGTGIHSMVKQNSSSGKDILLNLKYNKPVEVETATDIDDLR